MYIQYTLLGLYYKRLISKHLSVFWAAAVPVCVTVCDRHRRVLFMSYSPPSVLGTVWAAAATALLSLHGAATTGCAWACLVGCVCRMARSCTLCYTTHLGYIAVLLSWRAAAAHTACIIGNSALSPQCAVGCCSSPEHFAASVCVWFVFLCGVVVCQGRVGSRPPLP